MRFEFEVLAILVVEVVRIHAWRLIRCAATAGHE